MEVGHDLHSMTSTITYAVINEIPDRPDLEGRRIVILDTPGFNDNYTEDGEILKRIAVWLTSS